MSEIKHTIYTPPRAHTFTRNDDTSGGHSYVTEHHRLTVTSGSALPITLNGTRFTIETLEEILIIARQELAESKAQKARDQVD